MNKGVFEKKNTIPSETELHWLRASKADSNGWKAVSCTTLPNRLRSETEFLTASVFCPISSRPLATKRLYPDDVSYNKNKAIVERVMCGGGGGGGGGGFEVSVGFYMF